MGIQRHAASATTKKLTYSLAEAAEALGVSEGLLRLEAQRGRLRITRCGKRVFDTARRGPEVCGARGCYRMNADDAPFAPKLAIADLVERLARRLDLNAAVAAQVNRDEGGRGCRA